MADYAGPHMDVIRKEMVLLRDIFGMREGRFSEDPPLVGSRVKDVDLVELVALCLRSSPFQSANGQLVRNSQAGISIFNTRSLSSTCSSTDSASLFEEVIQLVV
jgi:hypothetical protein